MIQEFLQHKDNKETWAEIYRKGGEPLLRQWSKHARALGKDWIDEEGLAFHHGLRLYQALNYLEASDDEALSFLHLIPVDHRPSLLDKPTTGVKLIEALWCGPYKSSSGREIPDVGAMTAFMNHYDLAMHVFRTRPDLAEKLSPFVHNLYSFAARREDRQAS